MDNNILNKIDKTQLTKIDRDKIVNLEVKDLDSQVLGKVEDGEPYTPPCIHPAIHNYIKLNQFEVSFDEHSDIMNRVLSVTKPVYNVRKGKYVSHKILVAFEVVHEQHFFGKPSRYDNFYSDDEIIEMVNNFNEQKHAYMEVYEFDQNGVAKFKTTYTAPRIYRLDFAAFDMKKTDNKFYIAEVHYTKMTQEALKPEEPGDIIKEPIEEKE